jgi:hypothetical protein
MNNVFGTITNYTALVIGENIACVCAIPKVLGLGTERGTHVLAEISALCVQNS